MLWLKLSLKNSEDAHIFISLGHACDRPSKIENYSIQYLFKIKPYFRPLPDSLFPSNSPPVLDDLS